jgi:uncharacterized delta-60 repeat protein
VHSGNFVESFNPVFASRVVILFASCFFACDSSPAAASLVDTSFDPGLGASSVLTGKQYDANILAMAVQSDGKILVAGAFSAFNGVPRDGLVRLNTNGSADLSFSAGIGQGSFVTSLLLQKDGKIVVGFDGFHGLQGPSLARFNPDGSPDLTFNSSTNAYQVVNAVAEQPDGRILTGGLDGISRFFADGAFDSSFLTNQWIHTPVGTVAVQPDGKILAGGPARLYGYGDESTAPVRLNTGGSVDSTFVQHIIGRTGPDGLFVGGVSSVIAPSRNGYFAAGYFGLNKNSQYYTTTFLRLNNNGLLDDTFPLNREPTAGCYILLPRTDGRIILAGGDMAVDRVSRPVFAQISAEGLLDVEFTASFERLPVPPVSPSGPLATAAVLQPDGKLILAGQFTSVDGVPRMGMVRLFDTSPTNLNLLTLSVPSCFEGNTDVLAEVTRAGDLASRITVDFFTTNLTATAGDDYVATSGTLTFEPGEHTKSFSILIRDDTAPETNETFAVVLANPSIGARLGDQFRQVVKIIDDDGFSFSQNEYQISESAKEVELTAQPPQQLGYVIAYDTTPQTARPLTDYEPQTGTLEFSPWWQDAGVRNFQIPIYDNTVVDGNRTFLVTLRNPTSGLPLGSNATAKVTILDNDNFAGSAQGVNGTIDKAIVLPDGHLLIAGWFNSVDGFRRNYVGRLLPNGAADPSFDPGAGPDGPVMSLALQADHKIIIGGAFTNVSGIKRARIARLNQDGSLDATFDPGSGWQDSLPSNEGVPSIRTLAVQLDGKIMAGGNLTTFNGISSPCLARLNPDGSFDDSFKPKLDRPRIVRCLALQTDGKILIGGGIALTEAFLRLNSDGSTDAAFQPIQVSKARAALVRSNGNILVAGEGADLRSACVAEYSPFGVLQKAFNATILEQSAYDLAETAGGKLLVAGRFHDPNATPGLIRFNPDGTRDASFVSGTTEATRMLLRTIALQPSGEIFVAGTIRGFDDEDIALGRVNPIFGVPDLHRRADEYFWLRLEPGGARVNDLHFERLVRFQDGMIDLSVRGQAPNSFILQRTSSFAAWFTRATNALPNTGLLFRDSSATARMFYRVYTPN